MSSETAESAINSGILKPYPGEHPRADEIAVWLDDSLDRLTTAGKLPILLGQKSVAALKYVSDRPVLPDLPADAPAAARATREAHNASITQLNKQDAEARDELVIQERNEVFTSLALSMRVTAPALAPLLKDLKKKCEVTGRPGYFDASLAWPILLANRTVKGIASADHFRERVRFLEDPSSKCSDAVTGQEFINLYHDFINNVRPYTDRTFSDEQVSELMVRLAPALVTSLVVNTEVQRKAASTFDNHLELVRDIADHIHRMNPSAATSPNAASNPFQAFSYPTVGHGRVTPSIFLQSKSNEDGDSQSPTLGEKLLAAVRRFQRKQRNKSDSPDVSKNFDLCPLKRCPFKHRADQARAWRAQGLISYRKVPSAENPADYFTKPLERSPFEKW
eukprot:CAMPEP_0119340326 /NCGR_PEP_ID=MMETSP1333-20130426/100128_1 /TAXON_ID=418940 /ORGANISM="Scyphosphaera apsteinii, Strain RCC1455" /LENGTH=392 /DNA_ID=CAMNT_0007352057 /DNA_START=59 /DNA_END=1234 /DNA_ORIENTATION=+